MPPSIPKTTLPEVPTGIDPALRRFLTAVRNNMHSINAGMVPPQQVTNLSASPINGGNRVMFTRGDADYYVLRWSTTNDLSVAQSIDLGVSNVYDDVIGAGGVTRFYWIVSKKNGTRDSVPAGPVSSTSAAPGAGSPVPAPPPAARIVTTDQATGIQSAVHYQGGRPSEDL
jgi:hypothetical protein